MKIEKKRHDARTTLKACNFVRKMYLLEYKFSRQVRGPAWFNFTQDKHHFATYCAPWHGKKKRKFTMFPVVYYIVCKKKI